MYLQRVAAASFKSLACVNAFSLKPRIVTNMSNPTFPQRQPPSLSDEEILFTGRRRNRNFKRKERKAYRREHPEYVPGTGRPDLYPPGPAPAPRIPLPQTVRSGSGNGIQRDGGGRGLPPRPKTPEAWGNGHRADSRERRYGGVGRESQGRYESYESSSRRNESYTAPIYDNVGHRNVETAWNPQSRFYNHPNTSDNGGVSLHNLFDGHNSRGDQYGSYYYDQPPGGVHASSSAPGTYQPYERSQAPARRSQRLAQHPDNDNYRSGHRGSPAAYLSSRGPLSSSRFSQSINKHSRYAEPNTPAAAFSTRATPSHPTATAARAAAAADRYTPKAARKTVRKATVSPSPPLVPFPKTPLPTPKPSQDYLSLSLIPSPRLVSPARQLIILDLNGTLLAREKGRARCGSLNPTPRPGLGRFLRYLFAQFNVMVWSSAQPENVRTMVRALFSESQKAALLAMWGRDTLGLTKQQFSMKTQVYKRLERVWDGQYKIPHSEQGCSWDQTNTMLLDDSALKAKGQPWNHIEVPEFFGKAIELQQDRVLYSLAGYLEEAKWHGNVSAFIRAAPFKVEGKWDIAGAKVMSEYEEVAE